MQRFFVPGPAYVSAYLRRRINNDCNEPDFRNMYRSCLSAIGELSPNIGYHESELTSFTADVYGYSMESCFENLDTVIKVGCNIMVDPKTFLVILKQTRSE